MANGCCGAAYALVSGPVTAQADDRDCSSRIGCPGRQETNKSANRNEVCHDSPAKTGPVITTRGGYPRIGPVPAPTIPTLSAIRRLRICAARKDASVPATRGSERLNDTVDLAVAAVCQVVETVLMVIADGEVNEAEQQLVRITAIHAYEVVEPLPAMAAQVDNALRLIGAAAGAGAVTPWVARIAREAERDAA